ncbi:MAG: phosphatidylserine decarboxylase [Sutterellaceae bacterium]|nr:phosphatidylserine decarboxylase [Burkholderiaceae bacterium]MCX7900829.1 phosphatidylserine decarboxylase [Burkholderiaceae bacterium]MDW8429122.1 phosphatidylserine decarboxylase [Sutterellaceae bacterium]
MSQYPHPWLAREGWPFIGASVLASVIVTWWAGWWSLPLWLWTAFVVQFFRDPPRAIPAQANAVLAPADGRVVKVDTAFDPYTQREALLISVFMNVFNVHSNRAPVDGMVERVEYHRGRFINADLDKASAENERNAVVLRRPDGAAVTVVQVAGLIARRILCYVKAGDTVVRGQRYGFIRFGSRVDVYLPRSAKPRVMVGDGVYAARDIIAEL